MTPEKQLAQQIRDLIREYAKKNGKWPIVEVEHSHYTNEVIQVTVSTKEYANDQI